MNTLERSLQRDPADLGINPLNAGALGVDLVRLAAAAGAEVGFDWNALTVAERKTLSRLLAKGEADD